MKLGKQGNKRRKAEIEQIYVIIGTLLLLLLCVVHALSAGHYVNFYPTNGTFQNFNPVRRLLAGQVPYKDFSDYLGMGHLYAGTLMTLIFGGDYQGSLIAFSFLSLFGMITLALTIARPVCGGGEWRTVVGATNIILVILLVQPLFFTNGFAMTSEVLAALNAALSPGNSARYVRGLALPFSVCLFGILLCAYEKTKPRLESSRVGRRLLACAGAGCIAGSTFVWSNDYGISCFVCIAIMTFWVSLSRKRKFLSALTDCGAEIVASFATIFILVEILTWGHFEQWLKAMLGIGGFQRWYFNVTKSYSKSYYLFDIDITYIVLIQAFIALAYLVFLFVRKGTKEAVIRYGIPGFMNMTCFCAVNEYHMLSGGAGIREVAYAVLFLTIIFEMIRLAGNICKNAKLKKWIMIVPLIMSAVWVISASKEEFLFYFTADKDGKYFESLGGNMTSLRADVKSARKFLDGEDFFSTYASAQEVVEGKFQPSGIDYIIHVLGEEQREKYLHDFRDGDFKYAVTIQKSFTPWEYWVERANWFFYRELYRNWHPVFSNTYEVYWERNEEDEYGYSDNYDVEIQVIDDTTIKLILQTDKSINGIADVYIDYAVEKKPGSKLAKLMFQSVLQVKNTGKLLADDIYYESNYLKAKSAEYVPMPVTDGYGELTITSCPGKSTILRLNQVYCNDIYTSVNNS